MIRTEVMLMQCNNSTGYSLQSPSTANTADVTTENRTSNEKSTACSDVDMLNYQTAFVIEAYVEPWIFTIGFATNIVSFSVFYHMRFIKALKTVLLVLCMSDMLASAFGFTYILLEVVMFEGDLKYGIWSTSALLVFTFYQVYLLFTGMSSLLIKLGSILKTHALLNPLVARIKVTRKFVIKVMLLLLGIIIGLFLPLSLYVMWKACFQDGESRICIEFNQRAPGATNMKYYFFAVAMVLGPGTVIANIVCFILLKNAIRKSERKVQNPSQDSYVTFHYKARKAKQSKQINITFLYGLIVHSLCILPSCLQILFLVINPVKLVFTEDNLAIKVLDAVAEITLALLPCYNFFLYLTINKEFRKTFCLIYSCRIDLLNEKKSGGIKKAIEFTAPASLEAGIRSSIQVAFIAPMRPKSLEHTEQRKSVRFSEVITTME